MSKKVSFQTDRKNNGNKQKMFTILFVSAVLLLLGVSCTLILAKNNFDIHAAVGGDIIVSSEKVEDDTTISKDKFSKTYLLWCTNSGNGDLDFMWLVKADFPDKDLMIYSVSPSEILTYEETSMTVNSVYKSYNEKGLLKAFDETYGITIDSYLGSNTETFKQMINAFGSVNIELEKSIEYRGSFNLILPKGSNALKGDTVYKYLVYLSTDSETGMEKRSQTLIDIMNVVFLEKYSARTDRLFSKIANSMTTDITIVKYSASKPLITNAFSEGLGKIKISDDIGDIK